LDTYAKWRVQQQESLIAAHFNFATGPSRSIQILDFDNVGRANYTARVREGNDLLTKMFQGSSHSRFLSHSLPLTPPLVNP
jgi:hypothetical protein